MICSKCGAEAKPLFTGSYCTKDCDRPQQPITFTFSWRPSDVVTFAHPMPLYSANGYWACTAEYVTGRGFSLSDKRIWEVRPSAAARETSTTGVWEVPGGKWERKP